MAAAPVITPAVALKEILFATDFSHYSHQALPFVTGMARKLGSNIHLCHMVTPSEVAISAPETVAFTYDAMRKAAAEQLTEMVLSPELKALHPKVVMASGMLEDVLAKAVSENHIDLVVIGTHGRTGISRLVLGSAAEVICRVATCPVLTIGPDVITNKRHFERILVPTDFSPGSMEILPYVLYIAREYKASITFLHVIPTDKAVNVNARLLADNARRTLKKVFKDCGEYKPQFLIEFGHSAESILRVAAESKADLIAMGIRHAFMPGVQLRLGVAYRVMAEAQCPVLTCR
jgi:nucleotide-binding universal stress UspA family protein